MTAASTNSNVSNNSSLKQYRKECFTFTEKALKQSILPEQQIIHASALVKEITKTSNTLVKRLREWTDSWIPITSRQLTDHEEFVTKILDAQIQADELGVEIVGDKRAMIVKTAQEISALYTHKKELEEYIEKQLAQVMPSSSVLCGPSILAELLSHAGSIERLSKMPSGTIQLLGAETALFRHLRNNKNRPPKHGALFLHPLLQQAERKNRGKVARALADKIAITTKVDFFGGEPCGERLRSELEEKWSSKK